MALTQISTQGIKDGTITGSDLATNVDLVDNQKLRLGNSQDLMIYHHPTDGSIINHFGNNHLVIRSGNRIDLRSANDDTYFARFVEDGAAELYHDGSKKFETTSTGATVTGTLIADGLTVGDAERIKLGNDGDLELYHTGTETFIKNSTGTLNINNDGVTQIKNYADNEFIAKFTSNAGVELYYDNSKKFETTSSGATVSGDTSVGNLIKGVTRFCPSGSTTVKAMWDETGFSGAGHFQVKDGVAFTAGNSSDLQIYHDGGDSFIVDQGTGRLNIRTNGDSIKLQNTDGGQEAMGVFNSNGSVELYHNGSKKFETTSGGVDITGTMMADGIQIQDSHKINLGNSQDLQIFHDGSTNVISGQFHPIELRHQSEVHIKCVDDGAVELYFNNSLKAGTDEYGFVSYGRFVTDGDFNYLRGDSTSHTTLTLKKSASGADSISYLQCRDSSNGLKLAILGNGNVSNANNSYGSISDVKLKENIVDASSQWDDIKAIKVRNFNFKNDSAKTKMLGVVAQELETVSAGLIDEQIDRDDTGADLGTTTKGVKYSVLYMKAIKCLQEAMTKIETLETKVAILENK